MTAITANYFSLYSNIWPYVQTLSLVAVVEQFVFSCLWIPDLEGILSRKILAFLPVFLFAAVSQCCSPSTFNLIWYTSLVVNH